LAIAVAALGGCAPAWRSYETVAEARAAGAFERHELPDVIPASARDLQIRTKWWSRSRTGIFFVPGKDAPAFLERLTDRFDPAVWGADTARVLKVGIDGVTTRAYVSDHGKWLFSCANLREDVVCTWISE
jgi:hypothetical protein